MQADKSTITTAEQDLRECIALDHGIIERLLAGLPISIDLYIYHFEPLHYHIFSILAELETYPFEGSLISLQSPLTTTISGTSFKTRIFRIRKSESLVPARHPARVKALTFFHPVTFPSVRPK